MSKNRITNILKNEVQKNKYKKFIFLCIGTSESVGDAIGPKVGEILTKRLKGKNILVFGNKEKELNYLNINNNLNKELEKYNFPYIITIDSALGDDEYIGKVIVNKKYIEIGKALNKRKIIIGNLNIKAITGKNYNNIEKNIISIENYSEELVNDMANNISRQIIKGFCD